MSAKNSQVSMRTIRRIGGFRTNLKTIAWHFLEVV